MLLEIKPILSEKLFLKNPEQSDLGQKIIQHGVFLLHQIGFEQFTFKKLAKEIGTTEAGIYRYFENKHRFLHYLIAWHWTYLEYQIVFQLQNMKNNKEKIKRIIHLLVIDHQEKNAVSIFDKKLLYEIVISESSKVYLTKAVNTDNHDNLFKPYKDLCARIADLFSEYNSTYAFPHSLASTLVEMAHYQLFFSQHLPRLTDKKRNSDATKYVVQYLDNFVFSVLDK